MILHYSMLVSVTFVPAKFSPHYLKVMFFTPSVVQFQFKVPEFPNFSQMSTCNLLRLISDEVVVKFHMHTHVIHLPMCE